MDKKMWPPLVYKVSTADLNNNNISNAAFRFLCRLKALAWGKETLKIDVDDLKDETGLEKSALFEHARLLQLNNALLWRCAGSVFECSFPAVVENPENAEIAILSSLTSASSKTSKTRKTKAKDSQNPENADFKPKATTRQITDEYQHLLGRVVTDWAEGEASAAKEIAKWFTVEEFREAYQYFKSQRFWSDKRLPLRWLKNNIADYFAGKKNGRLNYATNQDRRTSPQTGNGVSAAGAEAARRLSGK